MLKLFWIALILGTPAFAEVAPAPIEVAITTLSSHPQEFDDHLVLVHAVLVFGWEGDNFLIDPAKPSPLDMPSRDPASVWFYCKTGYDGKVYEAIGLRRIVYGSFVGYFHFGRKNHKFTQNFDPGPLQFEAIGSAVPDPQPHSLAAASLQGDVDEIRVLLQSDFDINDRYRDILLFLAAESGRDDFSRELLASRADPKFAAPSGETALMKAARNCKVQVAKTLLSQGATVNAADINGETALIFAAGTCKDGEIVELLLSAGANPNARTTNGVTSLIAAAGNPLNVAELLKAGADPLTKTESGETVESESCDRGEAGHYQVCQLVRQALRKSITDSSRQ